MRVTRLTFVALALVLTSSCAGKSSGRIAGILADADRGAGSMQVEVGMTTCDAAHEILLVDESGLDTVIITIESTAGLDDDCGDVVLIKLSDVLGDRIVIDGHTGEPIPIFPP